jgi:cell wall-associated NlpC family hydrolase
MTESMHTPAPISTQTQDTQAQRTREPDRQQQKEQQRRKGRRRRERWRAGTTAALTLAAVAGSTLLAASPASAATIEGRALTIAESKHGDPYVWGAAGPDAFDCSGLTYYSFRHAGRSLPRTAQAQYDSVEHLSRSQLHPGDLVFFHSGGYVYHVGIYAGNDEIWHSPHPGARVRRERIWTSEVWYGRIR